MKYSLQIIGAYFTPLRKIKYLHAGKSLIRVLWEVLSLKIIIYQHKLTLGFIITVII